MARGDRFFVTYEQGGILNDTVQILVDRQTGVSYLFIHSGHAGGLTPLLDKDGKPVVHPIPSPN